MLSALSGVGGGMVLIPVRLMIVLDLSLYQPASTLMSVLYVGSHMTLCNTYTLRLPPYFFSSCRRWPR